MNLPSPIDRFLARFRRLLLKDVVRVTDEMPWDLAGPMRKAAALLPQCLEEATSSEALYDRTAMAVAELKVHAAVARDLGHLNVRDAQRLLMKVSAVRRMVLHGAASPRVDSSRFTVDGPDAADRMQTVNRRPSTVNASPRGAR